MRSKPFQLASECPAKLADVCLHGTLVWVSSRPRLVASFLWTTRPTHWTPSAVLHGFVLAYRIIAQLTVVLCRTLAWHCTSLDVYPTVQLYSMYCCTTLCRTSCDCTAELLKQAESCVHAQHISIAQAGQLPLTVTLFMYSTSYFSLY